PGGNSDGIVVGIDAERGSINGTEVLDLAIREPTGAVEKRARCESGPQAPAHGPKPIEIMLMREGQRRIEAGRRDGRIADRSRAPRGGGGALVSKPQVAFEAGDGHACLPVVTDLAAPDGAVMFERGTCCE